MPTSRFVVVSAPLEERVTASLAARAQHAVLLALRLKREVTATLCREDASERAGEALRGIFEPSGYPFAILVLLVAVLAMRVLLLRMETRRILRLHSVYSKAVALAPAGEHQHAE